MFVQNYFSLNQFTGASVAYVIFVVYMIINMLSRLFTFDDVSNSRKLNGFKTIPHPAKNSSDHPCFKRKQPVALGGSQPCQVI